MDKNFLVLVEDLFHNNKSDTKLVDRHSSCKCAFVLTNPQEFGHFLEQVSVKCGLCKINNSKYFDRFQMENTGWISIIGY